MKLLHKGDEILLYLLPEGFHRILIIAVASHAVIAQLHIVLITHFPGLLRAVFHQLVIDIVQLLLMLQKEGGQLIPGLLPDASIRILHVGLDP